MKLSIPALSHYCLALLLISNVFSQELSQQENPTDTSGQSEIVPQETSNDSLGTIDSLTPTLETNDTVDSTQPKTDSLQALVDSQPLLVPQKDTLSTSTENDQSSKLIEETKLYPLSIALKAQIKFIDFSQRDRFQKSLNRRESELKLQQTDPANAAKIRAQEFQRVNLAFPLSLGLRYRPYPELSLGLSAGYLYHQQETLLQIGNASRQWTYALETFPISIEIAHLIPAEILTVDDVSFLEIGGRLYGHYGDQSLLHKGRTLRSSSEQGIDGWGAFLSYQYMAWNRISIQAELEYANIQANSDQKWEELITDSIEEEIDTGAWDLGGIALGFQLMYSFGSPF